MSLRVKKKLLIGLVIISSSAFILHFIFFYYLMGKSPQAPNIATGQIYPLNNHGSIFYVTRIQNLIETNTFLVFFYLMLVWVVLEYKWGIFRNPREKR